MSDWTDERWNDFREANAVEIASLTRDQLLLVKSAWLHGARSALAQAAEAVATTVAKGLAA